MASAGSSSSASGAKAYARYGNLPIWTCKVVEFCRGVLKLSKNTDASQSALSAMPLSDHEQCFATVAGYMDIHGTSGAKAYAKDQTIQSNHIFRWKHVKEAQEVLALGPEVLDRYIFDDKARDLFGISDSTVTFNDLNKTPEGNGGLMSKAYAERQSSWEDARNDYLYSLRTVQGKNTFLRF